MRRTSATGACSFRRSNTVVRAVRCLRCNTRRFGGYFNDHTRTIDVDKEGFDMAQAHTGSGQLVSVLPLGDQIRHSKTTAVLKADQLEIIRIVLLAGKGLVEHAAPGEISVQCIEGCIDFTVAGNVLRMHAGDLVHLFAGEPHALMAVEDSSALLTIRLSGA
jgi:quercetin dioxygenase-like cupin family protein